MKQTEHFVSARRRKKSGGRENKIRSADCGMRNFSGRMGGETFTRISGIEANWNSLEATTFESDAKAPHFRLR